MVLTGRSRTRFSVKAEQGPDTLARVLEQFSIRHLSFDTLSSRRTEDGLQWIELYCCDVEDSKTNVVINKIKQIVPVQSAAAETTLLAS